MNIYESIAAAMADIGAVGKNSRNKDQGFMYRGIDAVMNAINPALVKNKIFIVPEVLEQTREERKSAKGSNLIYSICKVRYTFYAEDGSNVEATVIGEGMDTGDKATNKAMAIAYKYACFQVFCIPTEEMRDPDAECHEVMPKDAPRVVQNEPEPQPEKAAVENKKIDEVKIAALTAKMNEYGVPTEKILKLYKIQSLTDMTVKAFMQAMEKMAKIKEMNI